MQLDAGFGALTAVYELLLQNRADSLRLHHNLGASWTLNGELRSGAVLRKQCEAGERLVLQRRYR